MENIKIYEISSDYIDYLVPIAEHLYHNKKNNQKNERKYIGIVLTINGYDYFAPLSSFKPKHLKMKESIDFYKGQRLCGNQPKQYVSCSDSRVQIC